MFGTIGHTFELMKMSWRVLMLDRELILFPVMSAVGMVLLAGAVFAGGLLGGAFGLAEEGGEGSGGDLALGLVLAFGSSAIVIFFNAALVAAAQERLRGGDPNVTSGLKAASAHVPQILAWALITTAVTLILQALRERGGIAGQVASMVGGIAWSLATFFVIPLLVAEGIGPIEAIRRSSSLLRQTWGRQISASFGFGIVTIGAIIVAAIPGLPAGLHPPPAGPRHRHPAGRPRVGDRDRPRRRLQGRPLRLRHRQGPPRLRPRHPAVRLRPPPRRRHARPGVSGPASYPSGAMSGNLAGGRTRPCRKRCT